MDLLGLGKATQLTGDIASGIADEVEVATSVLLGDHTITALDASISVPVANLDVKVKAEVEACVSCILTPLVQPPVLPTGIDTGNGHDGGSGGGSTGTGTGNDPGQGSQGNGNDGTGSTSANDGYTEGNGEPTNGNTNAPPTNVPVPTNAPTVTHNPEGTSTPTGQSGGSGDGHGGNGGAQSTSAGSPSTGRSVPSGGVNPSTSPGAQLTATTSTTRLANNIAASSLTSGDVEPMIVTSDIVVTTTNADGHPLTYTTKSTFTLSNPMSAPTSTTPPTSSSRSSNLAGLIGGIVAGIIVLLILLALLIRYTRKRRARARSQRLLRDETTSSQAGIRSSYAATVSSLDFAPPTPRAVTRASLVSSLLSSVSKKKPEPENKPDPFLSASRRSSASYGPNRWSDHVSLMSYRSLTPVQEDANEKAAAQQEDARDPFADPSPRGQNDIETGMNPFADPLPAHHRSEV